MKKQTWLSGLLVASLLSCPMQLLAQETEETPSTVEEVEVPQESATSQSAPYVKSQLLDREFKEGDVLEDTALFKVPYGLKKEQRLFPGEVAYKDIQWPEGIGALEKAAITADYWYQFYAGQLSKEAMETFDEALVPKYQVLMDNLEKTSAYLDNRPLTKEELAIIAQIDQLNIDYYTEYVELLYKTLNPYLEQSLGSSSTSQEIPSTVEESTTTSVVETTTAPVNQNNNNITINNNFPTTSEQAQGKTTPIPFETRRYTNPSLPKGTEQVVQQGEPGLRDESGKILKYPTHQVIEFNPAEEESTTTIKDDSTKEPVESSKEDQTTTDDGSQRVLPNDPNGSTTMTTELSKDTTVDDQKKTTVEDQKKTTVEDQKTTKEKPSDSNGNSSGGSGSNNDAQPSRQTTQEDQSTTQQGANGTTTEGEKAAIATLGTAQSLTSKNGVQLTATLLTGTRVQEPVNNYQTVRLDYQLVNQSKEQAWNFKAQDFRLYKWAKDGENPDEYQLSPALRSTEGTVDANGSVNGSVFFTIPDTPGSYRLTWAPYGDGQYSEWYFTVDESGTAHAVEVPKEESTTTKEAAKAQTTAQKSNGILPQTGETRGWLFTVLGGLLLAIGGGFLYHHLKKGEGEDGD